MLKRLHLHNFTVFADADFEFGPGLNVIVGANGTGKSHVLKAGYALQYYLSEQFREQYDVINGHTMSSGRIYTFSLETKLTALFQPYPYQVNELIRRPHLVPTAAVKATFSYTDGEVITDLMIMPEPDGMLYSSDKAPSTFNLSLRVIPPVFVPAKEVLTLGWLAPMYALRTVPIDQTYPDLLRLLGALPLNAPDPKIFETLDRLLRTIGGKVEEEGGRFYLSTPDQPRMEMNMVAEGMRKFATLYKLLANGTLTPETTLFWDEPEANLNPALLKEMAAILAELARAGFQIILATHSLFLMKELHILSQKQPLPIKYFGLYADEKVGTQVETQDDFMQLQHIAALDAELAQTFDFEDALDQDYAGDS
ncbi:ATP/GTP-binding protein [Hymenobacter caeli]|uniref:Energy-coupling factor transporter ATP-binding protein EcfA2 n=1 Tax=Hymenobacter caeli TaxID=2735894 RepID=A0ABX2FSZ6_9BACT|nr:AAA family ATPase [Hymenobacter caeli]NRT19968.1 energy-coupling factor transporter ATP-binding protein EcfA2 [Hymenobacter caeli]